MHGINAKYVCVPLLWAQSNDGALASDIINLKNYKQVELWLMMGGTVGQTAAVTVEEGVSVSSAATALSFTNYFSTGFVLHYDGASVSTPGAAGETITGNGGGIGYVYKDFGNRAICYEFNGTTYVDNETLTFSGGKTAVANGIQINEDIMVPRTATSDTFDITAVTNKMYCVPVTADMLTDGYDCVELNIADANSSLYAAWAILTGARDIGEEPETAIY